MTLKVKIYLIVLPLLSMVLVNCSATEMTGLNDALSAEQNNSDILGGPLESASIAIYEPTLFPVLRTNCAACHGTNQAPLHSVADVNASHTTVLSNSLVDLKTPASSLFYLKINSGHQGFPPSVAMEVLAAITEWSNQLAALEEVTPAPVPVPAPTPTPVPDPAPAPAPVVILEPTYNSIRKLILEPKCISCHGAAVARAGVRYDSYAATLQTVTAGNPAGSAFYTEVQSGNMPRSAPSLVTNELTAISQWIANGALNN